MTRRGWGYENKESYNPHTDHSQNRDSSVRTDSLYSGESILKIPISQNKAI